MCKDLQVYTIEELEKHLYVNQHLEYPPSSEYDELEEILNSEAWSAGFLGTSGSGFLGT